MTNERRRPGNQGRHRDQRQAAAQGDEVPLFPLWVSEWGLFVLVPGGLLALIVIAAIWASDGPGDGLALFLAVGVSAVALLAYSYVRRTKAYTERKQEELRAKLAIKDADEMTWQEFEEHCGRLLKARHYKDVEKTRNVAGEKPVDFTAIHPDGFPVAIECKHRSKGSVGYQQVSKLVGDLNLGRYRGHAGILMTNALVSDGARKAAEEAGIEVVHRDLLARWVAEALRPPEQDLDRAAAARLDGWLRTRSTEAKAAAAALAVAGMIVLAVAVQIAVTPRPAEAGAVQAPAASKTPRPSATVTPTPSAVAHSAGSTPGTVVRAFLAAISGHDWPEVWKLGGRYIGQGQYASYAGMISGYQGTVRDVPVLIKDSGQTVSGRYLAYQADGEVTTYAFTYIVRGGVIVHAEQHPMATAGQQTG